VSLPTFAAAWLSASRAAINQYLLPAGWAHSSKLAAAAK